MSTDRPSRADRAQDTRERLVTAARRAFAERGYAAVSLDALAAEAGVTRGALHHHFTNREGLFEAVVRRIDAELAEGWGAAAAPHADAWAAFRAGFHRYLTDAMDPGRRRILFQDAPAVLGIRAFDILMESGFGDMVATLAGLIDAGRLKPVDATALGHMLNGAALNLADWAAGADSRLPAAHLALAALFDGVEASGDLPQHRPPVCGPGAHGRAEGPEQHP